MMSPCVSYLFARRAASAPCLALHSDDQNLAETTMLLGANGLFVRVATPVLRATLPLAVCHASRTIRGLVTCETNLAYSLDSACSALSRDLPCLAFAVMCPEGSTLPRSVGYGCAAEVGGPLTYIVADTGVYAALATSLFEARVCVAAIPSRFNLALDPLRQGITLRVPRIPALLLHHIVAEAMHTTRTSGHEALWQVRWADNAGWDIVRPDQEATASHVGYAPCPHPGIVLTIHSHGRHRTFWSETDDADEYGCGFNAVIGDLGDGLRSARILVRVSVFGYRLDLPASALFDGLLPIADGHPALLARPMHRDGYDEGLTIPPGMAHGNLCGPQTGPQAAQVGRASDAQAALPHVREPRIEGRMRRQLRETLSRLRRDRL